MAGIVPNSTGNIREHSPEELEDMPVDGLDMGDGDDETTTIVVDPKTGNVIHYQSDGSAIIDTQPGTKDDDEDEDDDFDANLALKLDPTLLAQIGAEIVEGVDADLKTRADFEDVFTRAVDLLGIKLDSATGQAGSDGTVSKIYSPLLLEATVKYQANFIAEMLPAGGPAKVKDDQNTVPGDTSGIGHNGGPAMDRDDIATAFEKDFNHYLLVIDKPFYPDTDRMAFSQGLLGNGFKKQYHDPLLRRPVSRSIPMQDLIVSNDATDLDSAIRVTHRSKLNKTLMKRMQLNKSYRNIDIPTPSPTANKTDQKIGSTEGTDKTPQLPQDYLYTVYETMVDFDLPGFEHKDEDGEITGLPLPYLMTVEAESKEVLAIRRNWKEGDEDYKKKIRIVHYPLIPGLGFYAYGFIQLLGNTSRALTGITRLLLDAGQFATFPGFLVAKGGSKQSSSELRVNPGTAKEIDTGGKPIQDVLMKIPYGEPSPTLEKMREELGEDGMRLAGAAQIPVGEGRADIPVGTMMAAVEQVTKVMAAVHKRNHQAQTQELLNLRELFVEDPKALSKFAGKKALRQWEVAEEFCDLDLVPASDPNVPSQIHRIMIATALIQLSGSPTGMQIYNQLAVHERALRVLGIDDVDSLFNPPAPQGAPPQDPMIAIKQQELDLKKQDQQIKVQEQQREASDALIENQARTQELSANLQNDQANRDHQEKLEAMKAHTESLKEQGKNRTEVQREHLAGIHKEAEAGIAAAHERNKTNLTAAHERASINLKAAHEHVESERQRQHEKEQSEKAAKAAKAQPKATAKPSSKKGK